MTLASARGRNCHMASVGKASEHHEMYMQWMCMPCLVS